MFPRTGNNLTALNTSPTCANFSFRSANASLQGTEKQLVYLRSQSPALPKQAELDVLRSHRRGFFGCFESFTNTSWNFILRQLTGAADETHLKLHLALPGRQPGAGAGGEPQSAADKWQKALQVPHVLFKPLSTSGFIASLEASKS